MKKILKGLLFAFIAVFSLSLVACNNGGNGEQPDAHEHELVSENWLRDSATHWKECKNCDEFVDMALHDYADWAAVANQCSQTRTCKVCGFTQKRDIDHTWGEWGLNAEGAMAKTCSVCGKSETVRQYYIRGTVNNWGNDGLTEDWALAIDYEKMEASLVVTLTQGDEFKIAGTSWDYQFSVTTAVFAEGLFSGTDNIIVNETAEYKIVVTGLGGSDHVCTITQLCVHEFDWTVVEGKTCDYNGVCSKCGATSSKTEHKHSDWTLVEGKTCDYEKVCECGDKQTKVEHNYVDGVCVCGAVNVVTYYLKGDMNGWSDNDAFKLVYDDTTKTATIVVYIESTQGFKVADSSWANQFGFKDGVIVANDGGSGNINVEASGLYKLTVSGLDTLTHTLTIEKTSITWYVKGDMNGWSDNDEYKLAYDEATDTATITVEIQAGQGFKVADSSWANQFGAGADNTIVHNDGGSANLTVETSGTYVITITNASSPAATCTIVLSE